MPAMAGDVGLSIGFGTPWAAQIDFLLQKLNLPTERWDDIQRSAHDRAFIVAGAQKAELLDDLHKAMVTAAKGGGLEAWRTDFKAIVARHGWTGWTGEGTADGVAWRTKVIYQTNMATSYAAARYQQLTHPDSIKSMPFWRYVHSDSVMHPREWHLAWNELTLPYDHPFWQTHFAPNGWGCQCRIVGVTRREGLLSRVTSPPDGWAAIDERTGAPVGIDKGWDYAPGASVTKRFQSLIDDKLIKLDAPIGARMWEELKPVLMQERLAAWQAVFDATRQTMQAGANTVMVHTISPAVVSALAENNVVLDNAAVWMRDTELMHAIRDTKTDRGAALPDEVWRDLPTLLESATPYWDSVKKNLIYVFELDPKIGKFVIEINYNEKGRFDGVRSRIVSNFVNTGGVMEKYNLETSRFEPLKK